MNTMPSSHRLFTLAAALVAAFASADRASAQTVTPNPAPTIITTAPYTISTPGYYQLGANINYAGTGAANEAIITINASNVILDLAGHYLAGPTTNAATTLYGIYANERGQVTIQNGTVAYCYIGVFMTGNGTASSNNNNERIQNMVVSRCYYEGLDLENVTDADILNNRFSLIGGTTTGSSVWGIYTFGTGIRVSGNSLSSITASGTSTATGIEVDPSSTGAGGFVYGNQISGATYGIIGGKYQQNLTDNCTTPLSNGTDAGLNN